MPETPEEFYERVKDHLRMPPVQEWDTFPFDGEMRPRALEPPVEREPPREGEGGVDCWSCTASDDEFLWANERWRLTKAVEDHGLPLVVLLLPREHYSEPSDLPDDLAAELGILLSRLDRAICSLGGIGRVHIGRWGEGGEHLHWWFLARPERMGQLRSSFALVWDDILPPTPPEVLEANMAALRAALG